MAKHGLIQRRAQEKLREKVSEGQERRDPVIRTLSAVAGQLQRRIKAQSRSLGVLEVEREITRAVLDSASERMQGAVSNLQKIEGVPEFVSGILSIFDPEDWSRQYQRLEAQAADIELQRQKNKLGIARKGVEITSAGVQRSISAFKTTEELANKTQAEIIRDINLEDVLSERDFTERIRGLEGLSEREIVSELSSIKAGKPSEYKEGLLEARLGNLIDRTIARETAKLSLQAGRMDLAEVHKANYIKTLSFNELDDKIKDMTEKKENISILEGGVKISLEELKQMRAQKQQVMLEQRKLSIERRVEEAEATGNIDNLVNMTNRAGEILSPEDIRVSVNIAAIAEGIIPLGGGTIAKKKLDEQIKVVQTVIDDYVKQQPNLSQAALSRYYKTGRVQNDATNSNYLAQEFLSTRFTLSNPNDPYGRIGTQLGITMRSSLSSTSGIDIGETGRELDIPSLIAQLGTRGRKVDPTIILQNASDEEIEGSNARDTHSLLMGAMLFKGAIRELSVNSPQFTSLLTQDGEDFKSEFKVGNKLSSGAVMRSLAEAQISLGKQDLPTAPFIEALLEKMRNPEFQKAFSETWMQKYNTFQHKSLIMFLTGGHLLRGVDGYFTDLQVRAVEAMNLSGRRQEQIELEARSRAKTIELLQAKPQFKGMQPSLELQEHLDAIKNLSQSTSQGGNVVP